MKIYQYRGKDIYIELFEYSGKQKGLRFMGANGNTLRLAATVEYDQIELQPHEIVVRKLSEEDGVLKFLVRNGITSPSKQFISFPGNFAGIHLVDLLTTEF